MIAALSAVLHNVLHPVLHRATSAESLLFPPRAMPDAVLAALQPFSPTALRPHGPTARRSYEPLP